METWVSVLVFGAVYALAIGVGKDRWCLLFAVTASFFGVAWIVDPDITLRMSPAVSMAKFLLENCLYWSGSTYDYMGLINKVDMVCLSPVGYGV